MGRRNIKNISFIIISVFLFTISLVGCTEKEDETVQHVELENEQKEELILAIGGEPDDGFDPITGWGRYGSPLFQSTLLKRDASFNVVPDVATSYKVSDDQLVWTVQLREDVLFSDGEP